jgi:hypothetical protein
LVVKFFLSWVLFVIFWACLVWGIWGFGFCVKVGNLDFGEGEYWIPAFAGMTIVSGNDNSERE